MLQYSLNIIHRCFGKVKSVSGIEFLGGEVRGDQVKADVIT
jgi:hypothetical protein